MKFKKCLLPVAMLASFTLAGCQSNADDHAADVYQTDQLNTKQETKTVNIISILPAKVAVDNFGRMEIILTVLVSCLVFS